MKFIYLTVIENDGSKHNVYLDADSIKLMEATTDPNGNSFTIIHTDTFTLETENTPTEIINKIRLETI
jgi:hypothetical protein